MTISTIELYDLLSQQLGSEKAKNLVTFVEAKVEEGLNEKTNVFATKEDIVRLTGEILKLDTKIAEAKTDMLKWFIPMFVTIMVMIVGLYLKK